MILIFTMKKKWVDTQMDYTRLSELSSDLFSDQHQQRWKHAGLILSAPIHPSIWQITVDRPQVSNALHIEAMQAFREIVDLCTHYPPFAIILYGEGGRFISGGDLKALHQDESSDQNIELLTTMVDAMHGALDALENGPSLVFAAIEGFAIGGGAEVALSADVRIGSTKSYFRFPQRTLGLTTGWGGGRRLIQCVGQKQALALLLSAHKISSQEALNLGLFHRVVEKGQTLDETYRWALECLKTPQASLALKEMCSTHIPYLNVSVEKEKEAFTSLWLSEEHWHQVDSFWKDKAETRLLDQPNFHFPSTDTGSQTDEDVPSTQNASALASTTPFSDLSELKNQVLVTWIEADRPKAHTQLNPNLPTHAFDPKGQKGKFIVIEGGDGAGTTTQAQMLTKWIQSEHKLAHLTREPSDGVIGKLVRKALSDQSLGHLGRPLPAESLALLFAADRADHWTNEIQPLLNEGVSVLCDRYLYSSLAYQGLEHPVSWIQALNAPFPAPDLLLYIHVSPEISAQRRQQRGLAEDRYETEEFQKRLSQEYTDLCLQAGAKIIDGNQRIDLVFDQCLAHIKSLFPAYSSSEEES